jgi:spoIIIJ-associated protein
MIDKNKVFEGKDLEEALQEASAKLGIEEPELDYEILEQGRRGLFGLGAKSVRIRVMPPVAPPPPEKAAQLISPTNPVPQRHSGKQERPPARQEKKSGKGEGRRERGGRSRRRRGSRTQRERRPARPREPRPQVDLEPPTPEQLPVIETLRKMIDLMGLELSAEGANEAGDLRLVLEGNDEKQLTRRDGELLNAFQFLLTRMARRAWPEVGRIHVGNDNDDEGANEERDGELVELVREVLQQVERTGKAKRLHPMNAYERRLVHITVRKAEGMASRSEGSGPSKRVKIYKK